MRRTDAPKLRIRMYNVGFGDALLFFVPTDEGERTVLVDCGVHPNGVRNKITSVVRDILTTVTRDGKARLDVIVGTHRHADHISGFDLKLWNDVEVGEVWLPWTEHPTDTRAKTIRRAQHRLAVALRGFEEPETPTGWLAVNSLSNAGAQATLQKGFAGSPLRRYLPDEAREKRSFTTPVLPGVVVHALGPSWSAETIATLDPPAGKYFPAARGLEAQVGDDGAPTPLFRNRFRISTGDYAKRFPDLYTYAEISVVQQKAQTDFLGLAAALEDAINGTSLMLVLEASRHCILLAGDAEWGTWSEVLEDDAWCELLTRIDVYKVSHHGSYNGTPPQFVDNLLPTSAMSLVSLRSMRKWPSIPRESLLTALGTGDRVLVRTDELPAAGGWVARNGDLWVEVDVPARPPVQAGDT